MERLLMERKSAKVVSNHFQITTKFQLPLKIANVILPTFKISNFPGFMYTDKFSSDYPEAVASKYTVCRSLGRGACGEVRIVYERKTCVQYAMKIVPKKTFSSFSNASLNNRELTEVEILKKLDYVSYISPIFLIIILALHRQDTRRD